MVWILEAVESGSCPDVKRFGRQWPRGAEPDGTAPSAIQITETAKKRSLSSPIRANKGGDTAGSEGVSYGAEVKRTFT